MTLSMSEKEAAESLEKRPPITVGDLFCGMGGWSEGFKMYNGGGTKPFRVIWGVDIWDRACGVHMHNHPDIDMVISDIRDLSPDDLDPVDVIVGSPPCPPYSSAKQAVPQNKRKGFELIEAFFHFVRKLEPAAWALENVVPMKSYVSRDYIRNLPDDHRVFIINGVRHGLPQRRRRCIVTNVKEPTFMSPDTFTLGDVIDWLGRPGDEPPRTVQNPLHYPQVVQGELADRHDLYEVKEEHITKLFTKKMMKKGAGFVEFPDPLDRASRTICAKPSPVGREPVVVIDRRFKPAKLRYLSLREQAMIQGFPADYKLSDSAKTHTQVMIGNAFPPLMAKSLATEIWKKVRGYD